VIVRTNSAGTVKVNATGKNSPEANQELFVFQKIGSAWKIARYCFSPPTRGAPETSTKITEERNCLR
jgi:hypothetical protein